MNIAVFASGGGSNFQAIADACRSGNIPANVVLCVVTRPDAGVVQRAARLDIRVHVLTEPCGSDADELLGILSDHKIDLVALAGYMRIVQKPVVDAYRGRILNIHPALLPAFGGKGLYGIRVHRAVLDYGVRWSGATVHIVDEQYDTGPIVLQDVVRVMPDDTPESLAARVLEVEHRLYPHAIKLFAEDRVRVDGRHVYFENHH